MWSPVAAHGRGTTTGYCTHSAQGKVTRGDYACQFFVSHDGSGFDTNVAFDAFTRMKQGKGPAAHSYRHQDPVDTGALRARSARYAGARRIA